MHKESNTTKVLGIQLQHIQPVVGFLALILGFGFVFLRESLQWLCFILRKYPRDV